MRIGFDARMIDHPGIGRYIKSLLSTMINLAKDSEFILYGEPKKLIEFKNKAHVEQYSTPIYSWSEFFSHPFKKNKPDIVHIPHFNVPFYEIKNLVVTIHDLIYLEIPESNPHFIKDIAVKYAISRAIMKAERVIAVSENTKKDIIKLFPDAEKKTKVIYEAADPIFKKIEDKDKLDEVRQKYNLPRDIILFVGSLKKHKNIERLIDVYTELKKRGLSHRLVIIGRYRPREAEILDKVKTTDALYLEEISGEDLVVIYNLATLLVIPSLYEGFGLPVLEAMACEVPVVCSNVASLPEIATDAALYFSPEDTEDMADVIWEVLIDANLRANLIRKGLKNLKRFSWEKTALLTHQIYQEVYAR
jgi:alpha-1,3-rhamnosyl/mannosyltransferase